MSSYIGDLSGREKAAILLITLGPDLSAQVMRHLREEDIDVLTLEIASRRKVDQEVKDKVLEEFNEMCIAQEYLEEGGIEYAKKLLEKALGPDQAQAVLKRLTSSLQVKPFDTVRKSDGAQILNFLESESPQTIALVLSYLTPSQAASILASLEPDLQVEVARRISLMERTSPDVVKEIERILERKVLSLAGQDYTQAGGLGTIVDILNNVDRQTERTILGALEMESPELAEEIKRRMFLFEDIIYLDDRSMQRLLRDVDLNRDLPLALKNASEEVRSKFFRNMSSRAVETLKESIDYLGPVRLRDVEEAQQRIVSLIRRLEEQGEIIIGRGGGDEIIV
ncbi:MAG: flagellar motor switch protein FliG [Bacillota bacterium]|jgi:flagellar motor switch protein FliG|nr:flagellar motor switch protein FliG [Candidatus Fermentithermobacillaceae bacterium]HAF67112.1 flagellar motor switch protein FliG [Clostridiales bacterium UBA9857]HOA71221.1 flagellar motor switch protein FliG [Bacillota bacterium]HPZ85814.1 flagellar motor switch protein FliG [Bacillota bacterium]